MAKTIEGQLYCSDLSIESGEELIATATPTSAFLLLEYNGVLEAKAFEASDIPEAVKDHLKSYTKSRPDSKALLIRSEISMHQPGIRFIVGLSGLCIYDFHVADYEDLLELDIAAVAAGDPAYDHYRRSTELYLWFVPTGAVIAAAPGYGIGVYTALLNAVQIDPSLEVWQCSHIGGHRFAANLIYLPAGLLYGRVRPEDVSAILAAGRERRMHLANLRGVAAYPPPVQAADAALRVRLQEDRLDAVRFIDFQEIGPGNWWVRFSTWDQSVYRVTVNRIQTGHQVFESCALDKKTPVIEYTFEIIQEV